MAGFLLFLRAYWKYLVVAAAIGVIYLWIHGLYADRTAAIADRDKAVKELADFVADVESKGKIAQARADAIKAADITKKEKADDELKKARTDAATANAGWLRERQKRADSGFVPGAAACPGVPTRAAFDRAELERALRDFDTGIQGLVDEGSGAIISLDNAKRWAQSP